MKTSNKILLSALAIIIVAIVAGLITTRTMVFSSITRGDGNITETSRSVDSYEKIKVTGNYKVYFTQQTGHNLTLTADANLHEFISTEVKNNELIIKSLQPIRSSNDFQIELTAPILTQIETNASAHFSTRSPLELPILTILANAGSRMEIDGIFEQLKVTQNAGANIVLTGKTDKLSIESNAGGHVEAAELEAQSANVNANAGASANVNAANLNASANAGARIKYIGNPIFEGMTSSAGGSISRL